MYESYFGLRGKPFQLNPDPAFFFGSRGHSRAMDYLEYGVDQGEGFIVITGEVGAGKTTVVRNLLGQLPDQSVVPAQIVSTQVSEIDLLQLVAAAFNIPTDGLSKASMLLALENGFRKLHGEQRRALLIVDEAQNLSPASIEELRMLSNFQVGAQSLVQSFLIGQPEFRAVMQRPEMRQLRQRVTASYHIEPLDAQETSDYIRHRLRHVGWQGDPQLDEAAMAGIFRFTAGVPRRINTLCDRLLLDAYLAERHTIGADQVATVSAELEHELGQAPGDSAGQAAAETGLPDASVALLQARLANVEARLVMVEARCELLQRTLAASALPSAVDGTQTPQN